QHVLGGGRLSTAPFQLGRAVHRDLHPDRCLLQHITPAFAEGGIQSGRGPQLGSVLDLDLLLALELVASPLLRRSVAGRIGAVRHSAAVLLAVPIESAPAVTLPPRATDRMSAAAS